MKFIIIVLSFSLLFLNCTHNAKEKNDDLLKEEYKFIMPIFIDTFDISCNYKNEIWLEKTSFHPIYIGPIIDSLIIPIEPNINHYFYYDNYNGEHDHYWCKDSLEFTLLADTGQIIPEYSYFYDCIAEEYDTTALFSYPVLIGNKSNDTLSIGYGNHIPIYVEAKDTNGVWRKIEEPYVYICGTELNGIFLPPGEIAITSAAIYKGNFKTKLRLKYYYGMCSEEFDGSINISQFESKWDSAGNRKPNPSQ